MLLTLKLIPAFMQFIMLYKLVLTFESVDKLLKPDHLVKVVEKCSAVTLFIVLYKVFLICDSVV